jgi:hypothetical protein
MAKIAGAFAVSLFLIAMSCGSSGSPSGGSGGSGTGGQTETGGTSTASSGGSGGSSGMGGLTGTGGSSSSGSGGNSGAGGAAQVACSTLPTGCTCSAGKPGASDPASCSKSSVATSPSAQGSCCKGNFFCTCKSYSCVLDSSLGTCFCDSTSVLATLIPSGTKLDQCPAPKTGNKCCYDSTLNSCDCNHASCSATATEVAACTLAKVTACAGSDSSVDACK